VISYHGERNNRTSGSRNKGRTLGAQCLKKGKCDFKWQGGGISREGAQTPQY